MLDYAICFIGVTLGEPIQLNKQERRVLTQKRIRISFRETYLAIVKQQRSALRCEIIPIVAEQEDKASPWVDAKKMHLNLLIFGRKVLLNTQTSKCYDTREARVGKRRKKQHFEKLNTGRFLQSQGKMRRWFQVFTFPLFYITLLLHPSSACASQEASQNRHDLLYPACIPKQLL